ncbi:hypothetical protein [Methylobacterium sp. 22177]|uniref:hypothetical protein n=1 Tax=Methylobacterium sp. 22177 TaxID=3453885 RepID=UPI003F845423
MAKKIEARRHGRAMHALPLAAKSHFRRRVAEARWGREQSCAAFAAVGVDDVVVHTLDLFDRVAEGIGRLPWQDRAEAEVVLFGQALPTGLAPLVYQVLDRGRADGLDDRQLAGALTIVLESHGLPQRDPAWCANSPLWRSTVWPRWTGAA